MTQQEALEILKTGCNAYITGAAGSGKTHLLNTYIEYLKNYDVAVGITASTGIAATHMGGVTIHSWTGLGIKDKITPYDIEALEEKPYLWKRIEKAKVLIIDEVSMLHHFRLDLVNEVLKSFKRNDLPFGGVQIILCGDFFQLPPVSRFGEPDPKFIYHSTSFKDADFKICYLEEQYRQNDDISIRVLNDIRTSCVDQGTLNHISSRFTTITKTPIVKTKPTRLYTHNIDVDKVNEAELNRLVGELVSYQMETRGNENLVENLKKSCLAHEYLNLKIGAKVMFVKNNFDLGYANGTLGIIKSFDGIDGGPVVETYSGKLIEVPPENWVIEEDGKVKAELKQYPLRLAWAITIHKSQGMSLDAVEVDLSKSFEKGMGYVALSRVRSWRGLSIIGFNETALKVNQEVLSYDKVLRQKSNLAKSELYEMKENKLLDTKQKNFLKAIAPKYALGADIKKESRISSVQKTLALLKEKVSIKDIVKHRSISEETVLTHIEKLLEDGNIKLSDIIYLKKTLSTKKFDQIAKSLKLHNSKNDNWKMSPVKTALGNGVTYKEIRLVRLFVKK